MSMYLLKELKKQNHFSLNDEEFLIYKNNKYFYGNVFLGELKEISLTEVKNLLEVIK